VCLIRRSGERSGVHCYFRVKRTNGGIDSCRDFVIVTNHGACLALGIVGSAQAEDAKQVFDFYCGQCHGVNGDGKGINVTKDFATDPRNFTNGADMAKRTG